MRIISICLFATVLFSTQIFGEEVYLSIPSEVSAMVKDKRFSKAFSMVKKGLKRGQKFKMVGAGVRDTADFKREPYVLIDVEELGNGIGYSLAYKLEIKATAANFEFDYIIEKVAGCLLRENAPKLCKAIR